MTLAYEDDNSKLVDVVTVADGDRVGNNLLQISKLRFGQKARVAELGSLSLGAKMATEIFVKRVFTIFATNESFLLVIANLHI